jgi:hypothetical protein
VRYNLTNRNNLHLSKPQHLELFGSRESLDLVYPSSTTSDAAHATDCADSSSASGSLSRNMAYQLPCEQAILLGLPQLPVDALLFGVESSVRVSYFPRD